MTVPNPPPRPDQVTSDAAPALGAGFPSSNVLKARLLIISGTGAGMFVYNGAPSLGNPPVFYVTSAGADPYGNVTTPFAATSQTAGGQLAQLLNASLLLTTGDASETAPGDITSQIIGSGVTRTLQTFLDSPSFGGATAELTLQSGSQDGSTFSSSATISTAAGGATLYVGQDQNGAATVEVFPFLKATQPATTVTEQWHTITPLNSWTVQASYGFRYRLVASPPNSVEVQGKLVAGTLANGTAIGTLPAGYRPTLANVVGPLVQESGSTVASILLPRVDLTTAGSLQVFNVSANTTNCSIHGFIPLD